MKTAIAIDSLISRDESTLITELVLSLLPNSELYTLVHQQGGILGRIEMRPIVSSFLTHKLKKDPSSVFSKHYWLIPSATKGLPLHPSIEKIVVISRGMIHGLNIPKSVEKFLYLLDWNDQDVQGLQKAFRPYVNEWRTKKLQDFDQVAISSHSLKNQFKLIDAKVIYPAFKTEDFPFVKDEDHHFHFTHHLIHTHGAQIKELKLLFQFLIDHDEKVRVLGPDKHLDQLKRIFPQIEFGGDHCEATDALYSHQAKVVWDFSTSFFPAKALGAMATGRPVIVRDLPINKEVLTQGVYFLPSQFIEQECQLTDLYDQIEQSYLSYDRRSLRRLSLKYNERFFKSRFSRFLNL